MTILQMHQEHACHPEIEVRLISHIKPFMKVLHLGCRYPYIFIIDSCRLPLAGTFSGGEDIRIFSINKLEENYNPTITKEI